MRILAVCRPAESADPEAFRAAVAEEMAALREMKARGLLLEAYSPGRPGAVLILESDLDSARREMAALPLAAGGLMTFELTPLQPIDL